MCSWWWCLQAVTIDIEGVRASVCAKRGGASTYAFVRGLRVRMMQRPHDMMVRMALGQLGVRCGTGGEDAPSYPLLESHPMDTAGVTSMEVVLNTADEHSPLYV